MHGHQRISSTAIVASVIALFAGAVGSSYAADNDTAWQKDHPRQEQVNTRLAKQNLRIHEKVQSGEMSKAEAATLHQEDRAIRKEERMMARHDGGHSTKAEQKALNQQENAVSKQIGK
ncbi:hypothetical protein ACFFKC_21790 [Pseudoduganella danionis]|uniref:DUF4148 domain-containing protein n=2 Tax=Telluria group TaxID=2895353 RepID=A0A845I325_9BURK|nr:MULTISPECIES: hypothetical protein [Telluria group]MTW35379.1 hypothetical protein [Pseudoduganella danionis]MYN47669.1 hypothetical protein [Duganella fentianensis]